MDEINALENQRDELEAALQKVGNAFSSLLKVCVCMLVVKDVPSIFYITWVEELLHLHLDII